MSNSANVYFYDYYIRADCGRFFFKYYCLVPNSKFINYFFIPEIIYSNPPLERQQWPHNVCHDI